MTTTISLTPYRRALTISEYSLQITSLAEFAEESRVNRHRSGQETYGRPFRPVQSADDSAPGWFMAYDRAHCSKRHPCRRVYILDAIGIRRQV